jgi:hypothetical protein
LSSPHLEASSATTFRACSSPAPTPVKPQPAPAILSLESVHTTLSITHHTRKRPSTGPRTTHGPHNPSRRTTLHQRSAPFKSEFSFNLLLALICNLMFTPSCFLLLTPKFGTGGSLICGPNLVKNPVQRRKVSSKRFSRDARGRQFCFRSARELFALISWDHMVTWPERKGRMDG